MKTGFPLENLPGFELFKEGSEAIRKGDIDSAPAQLLLMARTRLREAGLDVAAHPQVLPSHLAFYRILARKHPDAHYVYNAYLARLHKFCRAVESLSAANDVVHESGVPRPLPLSIRHPS